MDREKQRINKFKKWFNVIDSGVALCLLISSFYFRYLFSHDIHVTKAALEYMILFSVFQLITGGILAWSAFYLTRCIKELTGSNPNNCLLMWHIINVFLSACAFAVAMALFWYSSSHSSDASTPCEELNLKREKYRYIIGRIAQHGFQTYYDLFLLYLLYRYSSPFFSHGLAVPRVSDSAFDGDDTRVSLNNLEESNKARLADKE